MMPMESLHPLGKHDQNEVQHDHFGDTISLALQRASTDAKGIIHGIIAFLWSR